MNFRLFAKTFIYSVAVLICVSFLIFSSIKPDTIPMEKSEISDAEDAINEKAIPDAVLSHYMVILENESVNIYEVYTDNSKVMHGTLDIPTHSLREIDRINFEHGIIVQNADDILHMAEDFTS